MQGTEEVIRELTSGEREIVENRIREKKAAEADYNMATARLMRAQSAYSDVLAAMLGGWDDNVSIDEGTWRLIRVLPPEDPEAEDQPTGDEE